MNDPTVSVLIPTYNGRAYLEDCLASIRAQSYTDFEVVICDDQSSDGTLDYARELAGGDERFVFVQNPRRFGLVGNWNNCVAVSRGEWIKFVFQDDVIAPSCIERLLQACEMTGKPFSFCARDFIFEDGTSEQLQSWLLAQRAMVNSLYLGQTAIEPEQAGRAALENRENLVGEPTVTLIRKSVFTSVGMFDACLIQLCDAEFWIRVMSNLGGAWVPEHLATFRVHENATSATNRASRSFRARILDPLVLHYRLAFGVRFRKLRSARLRDRSSLDIRKECAIASFEAYSEARDLAKSDPDVMKEWKTVTSYCRWLPLLTRIGLAISAFRSAKATARRLTGRHGPGSTQ